MIIEKLSSQLEESIQSLIIRILEADFATTSLSIRELYPYLSKLSNAAEFEAESYISKSEPEKAAAIFIIVSEVLDLLSKTSSKEMELTEKLRYISLSWSERGKTVIERGRTLHLDYSSNLSNATNYADSSLHKTKAANLDYDTIQKEAKIIIYRHIMNINSPRIGEKEEMKRLLCESEGYSHLDANTSDNDGGSDMSTKEFQSIFPDDIKIVNDYRLSQRPGYYDWKVYLDNKKEVTNKIQSVTYTLHPTFRNPIREIANDPTGQFALKSNGWGEFEIKADIKLTNGKVLTKYHWLNLGSPEETIDKN